MTKGIFYSIAAIFLTAVLIFSCGHAGEGASSGRAGTGQINAFIYHHVGREEKYPSTSVSAEQFGQHVAYLKEHQYTVLPLGEALGRLGSENGLPEKTAVITMDDGYRSVFTEAVPILDSYGYKATIFVATQYVGSENYLTWQQIASLQEKGFEIGNHSHSHAYFLNSPGQEIAERFAADLEKSHELFRRHLDFVPGFYAYPFGEYNLQMIDVLKKYGYTAAAAQKSGVIYEGSDPYVLPRFPMNLRYGRLEQFAAKVRMKALPVKTAEPAEPVFSGQNPPELSLTIQPGRINAGLVQCFVDGRENCIMEKTRKNGRLVIKVRATAPLRQRRTLYTVTAPSLDGRSWYWYSHLWVAPQYDE